MTETDRIAQRTPAEKARLRAIVYGCAALVSEATEVPFEIILSERRDRDAAYARQWVMFEARQRGLSYPEIGYALKRDHTTIIHGVRAEAERRGVSA